MNIFEPREIEFKTGRTKDEVKERFKKRASITGDQFSVYSELFTVFARTFVRGKITTTPEWTVVSFTIYPSSFLKGMFSIAAVVATVIGLMGSMSELACGQFPYPTFCVLDYWRHRGESDIRAVSRHTGKVDPVDDTVLDQNFATDFTD